MKNVMLRILSFFLCLLALLPCTQAASAYTPGEAFRRSMGVWIRNDDACRYVEMMLDYHVRTNKEVQNALAGGFSAVFLFDGCSDNMDDPVLSDLSYYRVSGVCVVLRQGASGEVEMVYFSDNASTIPDRPLKYGAWRLPEIGDVGPATVLDGTYQLYSVYHKGDYEALNVRTDYYDGTLGAIYMTPEGFAPYRANEINIHTRTSNHIGGRGMWSAGCPLVGDGGSWEFWKLMQQTYHRNYETFEIDNFVGTLTIDRQMLRREMYTLYKNPGAVDAVIWDSTRRQPEVYLEQCGQEEVFEWAKTLQVLSDTQLMSLPCSNGSDARSLEVGTLGEGQLLTTRGRIFNTLGNLWYEAELDGQRCYVFAGHVRMLGWFESLWQRLLG